MSRKLSVGQSLVEFALIIPILLLLVMGALELGRLFYIKVALHNAAREGAYYLSYNPADADDDYAGTKTAVQNEAIGAGIDLVPDRDVVVNNCCTRGTYVEVEVKQDDVPLLVFGFLTGNVDLSSRVRMMVQ